MDAYPSRTARLAPLAPHFVALCLGFASTAVLAFGEDVCFTEAGSYLNCTPLPAECPPGDASDACIAAYTQLVAQVAAETAQTGGARSLLHHDYSYYLAQFIGYTPEQAYWLAAYNEAADLAQYVPRDKNGALLADPVVCASDPAAAGCALITRSIDGLERNNLPTGGVFFHFDSPYTGTDELPVEGVNGLAPVTGAPAPELMLAHLKRWADPASGSSLLCAHGITERSSRGDYATGSTCYKQNRGKQIAGNMTLQESAGDVTEPLEFTVPTGEQVVNLPEDGSAAITGSGFDAYVGEYARYARIGIYLHAYQDRISHHRCLDRSMLSGPAASETAFQALMINENCGQGDHLIRHGWEIGVPQSGLATEDQTMGAALSGSYDELLSIAQSMGVASSRAQDPAQRQAFIDAYYAALQIADPKSRVLKLAEIGAGLGLQPLPGF